MVTNTRPEPDRILTDIADYARGTRELMDRQYKAMSAALNDLGLVPVKQ